MTTALLGKMLGFSIWQDFVGSKVWYVILVILCIVTVVLYIQYRRQMAQ